MTARHLRRQKSEDRNQYADEFAESSFEIMAGDGRRDDRRLSIFGSQEL
jgi:hypothetical protein